MQLLHFECVPLLATRVAVCDCVRCALNQVMAAVQRAIYKYEGSLNKFLVDDKGSTLLAVHGLPPLAHEDDPERSVLTALMLAEELHK